jgi:hypothetical protein
MSGTWIAKPLSSLNSTERSLFHRSQAPSLPLSQTLEWGAAMGMTSGIPFLIFSPERRVSAIFLISGTDAECVNGPVLDWAAIRTGQELNEQVSMVVYALHQSNPALQSVRIRPRLSREQFEFMSANLAFPVDRVDQARTMILDLKETEEAQWRVLPPRVRSEISRSMRSGVQVSARSTEEGLSGFWESTRSFYQKRGLFVPGDEWVRSLLLGHSDPMIRSFLVEASHEESGSQAELLLLVCGGVGFYFFAHEKRSKTCPKLSLNICAQWEAIKTCIRAGVRQYDLNGVADPNQIAEEKGSFLGVDFYKRKFKGREVLYFNPMIRFGAV